MYDIYKLYNTGMKTFIYIQFKTITLTKQEENLLMALLNPNKINYLNILITQSLFFISLSNGKIIMFHCNAKLIFSETLINYES